MQLDQSEGGGFMSRGNLSQKLIHLYSRFYTQNIQSIWQGEGLPLQARVSVCVYVLMSCDVV